MWEIVDWLTVAVEFAVLVAVPWWRAFRTALAFATLFHLGVLLVMNIVFVANIVAYGAFVSWGRATPANLADRANRPSTGCHS